MAALQLNNDSFQLIWVGWCQLPGIEGGEGDVAGSDDFDLVAIAIGGIDSS